MQETIRNQGQLGFNLCGRHREIESNRVELHVVDVEFEKHGPECNHVVEGENVEFRFVIKNKSNVELENVEFRDHLVRELEFVEGSFRVNGRPQRPNVHRNTVSFRFHRLRPGHEEVITFLVKVSEHEHGGDERPERPPWRPTSVEVHECE